ncbi:MAG: flagellar FliJ family protein, partial [Ottowia sp.]|nr:flagellar FliJ family protein [Ottowia sp.]
MPRPFPLKPLLDLTQTRLDDAAKTLGELVAKETEHSQKLQLLEEYRQDYFQRFEQAALDGISPDMWRNYSAFI